MTRIATTTLALLVLTLGCFCPPQQQSTEIIRLDRGFLHGYDAVN